MEYKYKIIPRLFKIKELRKW